MTATCPNCEPHFAAWTATKTARPPSKPLGARTPGAKSTCARRAASIFRSPAKHAASASARSTRSPLMNSSSAWGARWNPWNPRSRNAQCSQSDVDVFDARGCPLHDGNSSWNLRLRALTLIQEYEAATQSAKRTSARDRELEGADRHALAHQHSIRTRTYRDCGGNDASSQTRHRHGQEDVMKQEKGEAMKETVEFPDQYPGGSHSAVRDRETGRGPLRRAGDVFTAR